MNPAATLRVLRRRWPVLVVGLALVVGGVVVLAGKVKASWKVDLIILLVPPPNPAPANPQQVTHYSNPILLYDASIATVANMTVNSVSDAGTAGRLAKAGATASYSVTPGLGAQAAELDVETTDRSRAVSLSTATAVEQAISDDLAQRQAARVAPLPYDPVTAHALAPPRIQRDNKNRSRLLAAAGAGGVVAVVMAAFALEGVSERRREAAMAHELGDAQPVW